MAMESENSIKDKHTDKIFEEVARVFAEGGGRPEGKRKVRDLVHTVWVLAQQYRTATICNSLKNRLNEFCKD